MDGYASNNNTTISISRREFAKKSALLAVATATLALPGLEGCTGNEVESLINTVADSALNLIAVADPGASWITPLTNAVAALKQAETTWAAGGAVAIIEEALSTVEAVLAVIPITAVYAPLVAILVSGIDAVLNALPTTPAATAALAKASMNPYHGRVTLKKPHVFQTKVGAYKSQWNATAKQIGLPHAVLT